MPDPNGLDVLRSMAANRQQQRQAPKKQQAPQPDVGAALARLGSLASGGGPLTDADLMNLAQYDGEPLVKIRNRILGEPIPENYGKDINLPVEEVSAPTRFLRMLRQKIGM